MIDRRCHLAVYSNRRFVPAAILDVPVWHWPSVIAVDLAITLSVAEMSIAGHALGFIVGAGMTELLQRTGRALRTVLPWLGLGAVCSVAMAAVAWLAQVSAPDVAPQLARTLATSRYATLGDANEGAWALAIDTTRRWTTLRLPATRCRAGCRNERRRRQCARTRWRPCSPHGHPGRQSPHEAAVRCKRLKAGELLVTQLARFRTCRGRVAAAITEIAVHLWAATQGYSASASSRPPWRRLTSMCWHSKTSASPACIASRACSARSAWRRLRACQGNTELVIGRSVLSTSRVPRTCKYCQPMKPNWALP